MMDDGWGGRGRELELLERLGAVGASAALLTAGYYVWIAYGYIDLAATVLQWGLTLSGAALLAKSLSSDHVAANRIFEGRMGLALGSSVLVATAAFAALRGWSQPGYALIEAFSFALSAIVLLNSAPGLRSRSGLPLLEDRRAVTAAGIAGSSMASALFSLFSLSMGYQAIAAAFAALAAVGPALMALRLRWERALPPILMASAIAFTLVLASTMPPIATDELALTSYAAHLILSGVDPYKGPLSGAFHYFGLSGFYETPLSTGGYVDWLSYPALSFLVLVPAVALGVEARMVLIASTAALLAAIYARYRGYGPLYLIAVLIALVDANVLYYPAGSVPDVVWAFLLGLSLVLLPRGRRGLRASAVLYGLSLAAKQIPAVVAPYLLYMVYRDNREGGEGRGRGIRAALEYLLIAAASFLLINAPFMAMDPRGWMAALVAPEVDPLVGIGQGISMLSFLGYYGLRGIYFPAMELSVAMVLLALYAKEYPRYRLSFLAFPIAILFFNYRFLFNYVIYWPVLALLVLPDALSGGGGGREREGSPSRGRWIGKAEAAALIALVVIPAISAPALRAPAAPFSISGISNASGASGYVTSMDVNVSWPGGPPPGAQLQFRMFPAGTMTSVNGLLWGARNHTEGDGWMEYAIAPIAPGEYLPQGTPFLLEAYYGGWQSFLRSPGISPALGAEIANPSLQPFQGSIPGWAFSPDDAGGRAWFEPAEGGVILGAAKEGTGWAWAAAQLVQEVNLSALRGYTLSYSLKVIQPPGAASNATEDGDPDVALGVEVYSGPYEVWYLYSGPGPSGVLRPNPHTAVVMGPSTSVDLSMAYSQLESMGWSPGDGSAYVMLIVGSQRTPGAFEAEFGNLTLIRQGGMG